MPNTKFDAKSFNAEAFKYKVGTVPNLKMNELKKSSALVGNPDIKDVFSSQNGTGYARIAMRGLADGDAVNYDGQTDITATSTKTFEQGVVVVGRAKGWVERDFSYDITGGEDFMENIAEQISGYWEEIDQDTVVSVLKGVFSMADTAGAEFVSKHTYDVTEIVNSEGVTGKMDGTTLNTGIQKACGDNKGKFSLAIMHSAVATNLENLKLLTYLKYTDANGMERDLAIGTLNGRIVLVDDSMPVDTTGTAAKYTTYVLGDGAIEYTDCGAKVPYEVDRDPKTNGGQDTLYSRQRKSFAPYGISFTMASMASDSPTDAELEMGANWELVSGGTDGDKQYISHKAIPIARIISLG